MSIYKKGFWYDVYGKECGPYLIHPDIWVYEGSSGVDTDSLYPFKVNLYINDTSSTDSTLAIERIRKKLRIDSLKVVFLNSGLENWRKPSREFPLWGRGGSYPGINYYLDTLTIPADIDSITVVVPIYIDSSARTELLDCDTLIFNMHRKETSRIGPLTD